MSIREHCYGKINAIDYVHTPRFVIKEIWSFFIILWKFCRQELKLDWNNLANKYLFKFNNKYTRKGWEVWNMFIVKNKGTKMTSITGGCFFFDFFIYISYAYIIFDWNLRRLSGFVKCGNICLEKIKMIFYSVNFFKTSKVSLSHTFYRCERHLKIFGRDAQEMKIAKYFGEKLIFKQQSSMAVFPRAAVASIVLQNLTSRRTTGIFCF